VSRYAEAQEYLEIIDRYIDRMEVLLRQRRQILQMPNDFVAKVYTYAQSIPLPEEIGELAHSNGRPSRKAPASFSPEVEPEEDVDLSRTPMLRQLPATPRKAGRKRVRKPSTDPLSRQEWRTTILEQGLAHDGVFEVRAYTPIYEKRCPGHRISQGRVYSELTALAREGHMKSLGDGRYRLTASGRKQAKSLVAPAPTPPQPFAPGGKLEFLIEYTRRHGGVLRTKEVRSDHPVFRGGNLFDTLARGPFRKKGPGVYALNEKQAKAAAANA
jgi:DNA-binding PadR family transcriptional regulator